MGWQSDLVVDPGDRSGIVVLSNANGGIILNLALISRWAEWKTGSPWPGAGLYLYQYPILLGLALVLGFICTVRSVVLARQFKAGRRRLLFKSSEHWKLLRVLLICLFLAMSVFWWLLSFTAIIDPRQTILWLPEPFLYVSVLFTCQMLLLAVATLFPRTREDQ